MAEEAARKLPTFPCLAAVTSTLHAGSNVLRLPGSGLVTSTGAWSARLVHLGVVVWRRMETFGRGRVKLAGLRSGFGTCERALEVRKRKTKRNLGGPGAESELSQSCLGSGISRFDSGARVHRGLTPE